MVLTMTPQRAQLVADSIELGDADHTPWLDSLADLLRSAAGSTTSSQTPRRLRRDHRRGRGRVGCRPPHSLRRWRSPPRRS